MIKQRMEKVDEDKKSKLFPRLSMIDRTNSQKYSLKDDISSSKVR